MHSFFIAVILWVTTAISAMENNQALHNLPEIVLINPDNDQLHPVAMVYENSFTTKTRRLLCQCCVPKVTKLAISSCICGKSCTETAKNFGEVKVISTLIPFAKSLIFDPYCWGTTICVAGATGLGCFVYRNNICGSNRCNNRKSTDI